MSEGANFITNAVYTTDSGITVQWTFGVKLKGKSLIVDVDDFMVDPKQDKQNSFMIDSYKRSKEAVDMLVCAMEQAA